MKRYSIIVLLVLAVAALVYSVRESPHDFRDDECRRCHIDTEGDPKKLVAPITRLCRKCHRRGMRTASHPVDIRPETVRIPRDMPLKKGKLTCNTCHNVHGKRYTAFAEKSNYLRRTAKGRDFCAACHKVDPLEFSHIAQLATAHMARKYRVTNPNQPLDPVSINCIGCHDGTLGREVDYVIADGEGFYDHNSGSHPVGVDYRRSRMEGGGLAPVSQLKKKNIRLFGGRIGCGTCHDPYSKLPGQLVMSNIGSKLCLECHIDK